MFRSEDAFYSSYQEQDGNEMPVGPHPWFIERMPDGSHPQDADGKGDRSCHRERLHGRAVKPVMELPVAEEICGLEQECRPGKAGR